MTVLEQAKAVDQTKKQKKADLERPEGGRSSSGLGRFARLEGEPKQTELRAIHWLNHWSDSGWLSVERYLRTWKGGEMPIVAVLLEDRRGGCRDRAKRAKRVKGL